MPVDLLVSPYIMIFNYVVVIITLIITNYRIIRLPKAERVKQCYLTFPYILLCLNIFLFYTYTFLYRHYYNLIPREDSIYYAWGSSIILHAILNILGIELTRLKLDGH